MSNESTNRRSRWQVLAAKRYPRLTYIGGDGGEFECWVVLTKCKHEQTRGWRYSLRANKAEAEALLRHWAKNRCAYQCNGVDEHALWKLS